MEEGIVECVYIKLIRWIIKVSSYREVYIYSHVNPIINKAIVRQITSNLRGGANIPTHIIPFQLTALITNWSLIVFDLFIIEFCILNLYTRTQLLLRETHVSYAYTYYIYTYYTFLRRECASMPFSKSSFFCALTENS